MFECQNTEFERLLVYAAVKHALLTGGRVEDYKLIGEFYIKCVIADLKRSARYTMAYKAITVLSEWRCAGKISDLCRRYEIDAKAIWRKYGNLPPDTNRGVNPDTGEQGDP